MKSSLFQFILVIFLYFLSLIPSTSVAQNQGFQSYGPDGGYCADLMRVGNEIWAGGAGIWSSTDEGETWQQKPFLEFAGIVRMKLINDTIYVLASDYNENASQLGYFKLYYSADYGSSWFSVFPPLFTQSFQFVDLERIGATLFVSLASSSFGGNKDFYFLRSDSIWVEGSDNQSGYYPPYPSPDPSYVYYHQIGTNSLYVWYSDMSSGDSYFRGYLNGGTSIVDNISWNSDFSAGNLILHDSIIIMTKPNPNQTDIDLFRSTDNGQNFSLLFSFQDTGTYNFMWDVRTTFKEDGVWFIYFGNNGFKSDDLGLSWSYTPLPYTFWLNPIRPRGNSFTHFFIGNNLNQIFPYECTQSHFLKLSNGDYLCTKRDDGISRYNPVTGIFTPKNFGFKCQQGSGVLRTQSSIHLFNEDDYRSDDSGQTWQKVGNGLRYPPGISYNAGDTIVCIPQYTVGIPTLTGIEISFDNGNNFQYKNTPVSFWGLLINNDTIYAWAQNLPSKYYSVDWGNTWTQMPNIPGVGPAPNTIPKKLFNVGQGIYGVNSFGTIYQWNSSTTNWDSLYNHPYINTPMAMDFWIFHNRLVLYSPGIQGYYTDNWGQSWQTFNSNLQFDFNADFFSNSTGTLFTKRFDDFSQNIYYFFGCRTSNLYTSNDTGLTWFPAGFDHCFTVSPNSFSREIRVKSGDEWIMPTLFYGFQKLDLSSSGFIQGRVYSDVNSNGLFETGVDFPLQGLNIEGHPAGMTTTNSDGKFIHPFLSDADSITLQLGGLPFQCNVLTQTPNVGGQNDFPCNPIGNVVDLEMDVTVTPGFWQYQTSVLVHVHNNGNQQQNPIIKFLPDTGVYLLSTTPGNYQTSGDTIILQGPILSPGQNWLFHYVVNSSLNYQIGDSLRVYVHCETQGIDLTPQNNFFDQKFPFQTSFDPNDKQCLYGPEISLQQIAAGDSLTYQINFQNLGNFMALNVRIIDTLSSLLNPSTFNLIGSSHNITNSFINTNGVLILDMNNIQLPPESQDTLGSMGFVKFSIQPKSNLMTNQIIENRAAIIFDFNPEIITNTVGTTVVDPIITPLSPNTINHSIRIVPNPTKDNLQIILDSSIKINEVAIINLLGGNELLIEGHKKSIELVGLAPGVYFILVKMEDGTTYQSKFIKAN